MDGVMRNLMKDASKPKERTFWLIRHGETALNKQNLIRAWSDIGLDEKGLSEAESLGKKLKGAKIDMLVASDLTRTLQTALRVSCESGIPLLATTLALRPWNVGKYTAQPADEVHKLLLKYAIEKPEENLPEGESFDSFRNRVIGGVIAFLNEYKDKNVAFVAHHRNDRLLRAWLDAGAPDDLEIDFDTFTDIDNSLKPGEIDEFVVSSKLLI